MKKTLNPGDKRKKSRNSFSFLINLKPRIEIYNTSIQKNIKLKQEAREIMSKGIDLKIYKGVNILKFISAEGTI